MGDVLSNYWRVCINGEEIDEDRRKCIEDINIQENCDYSDTCTIKVNDPDFLYIEDNIFLEDAKIDVEIGFHGETERVNFTGYISAIDIDFPEKGYPMLSIFCLDNSHVMNRKKKTRSWDNITRAEVVQNIAREYGFKFVSEAGYTYLKEDTISQSNVTDIEFCENLAREERVPFMCKLIKDTVYYVKKGLLKDPTSTLYYKQFPHDVISFTPQINKETLKTDATYSDIDTAYKAVNSSTSNSSNTSRDVQGKAVDSSSSSNTGVTYNPTTGKWS